MLAKRNYKVNKNVSLPEGTINGQGRGNVSLMRYGLFPMARNGCGMIGIYNFCYINGIDCPSLPEIALEMYPKCALPFGIFGSNVLTLDLFFKERGIELKRFFSVQKFFDEVNIKGSGLLSTWNAHNPLKGQHIITVEKCEKGIRVYNRYNNTTVPVEYSSYNEFTDKFMFVCGYTLK